MDKMAAGGICVSCVLLMAGALTVKGHTPQGEWTNSVTSYNYGTEERTLSDTYTTAYVNVTYEDEHGEIYSETLEVGKYGEGYAGSAAGVAVHARAGGDPDDHSGCTRPLAPVVPLEPWIAVVRRGKCNFEVKVANAFDANASAILVYNDRDATSLDKMKLLTIPGRNMSAVFTYKWKGEEIARLVDNGTTVYVTISKARNCSRPYNINRASVLFVSISFIVLMIISLAWLVFYYIQRFRYIHAKDRLSKRLCCAAKKALSKIPVKNLKSEDREVQGDGECCAVCIEPYKISDLLRTLPCRHDFHKTCIDPWLLEHRTCPMCKMDILKYYGFVFTGSQESILQLDVEEGRRVRALSPSTRGSHTRQITRENSFTEASSERSSRASSPDELTPSLRTNCGGSPSHAATPASDASPAHSHSKDTKSREGSPKRDLQQSTNEPMTSNGTTVIVTMPPQD